MTHLRPTWLPRASSQSHQRPSPGASSSALAAPLPGPSIATTGPTNPGYGYSTPVQPTPMPIGDNPWTQPIHKTHPCGLSTAPTGGAYPVVSVDPPLFFSLAFSGFARSGAGVSCWCSLLLFCVPLFAFRLSNSSPHFRGTTLPKAGCVCVCVCVSHLYRCKTSYALYTYTRGITGVPGGSVINEDTSPGPVQTYPRDCGDAPGRI